MTILFGVLAAWAFLFWVPSALAMLLGLRKLPKLPNAEPLADSECPRLSIIVPACNEADTVEPAMRTLLTVNYPHLQIVAINDRSIDSTGEILDRLAREDARLKVLHIRELPGGWLGKNHSLQRGAEIASGEWILFTDADVHYERSALRRALAVALQSGCDHLVALPFMILHGFWEKALVGFFGAMFCIRFRPWKAAQRGTPWHVGVGAFNMIKTSTYRAIGGHESLRMDVLDDVKLGKLVKQRGYAQCVIEAGRSIAVRWLPGLSGIVKGLEKNAFAGNNYSWFMTLAGGALILAATCWPLAGIFLGPLWSRVASAMVFAALPATGFAMRRGGAPFYFAVFWPAASVIFCYILIRSAWISVRQGGVRWRGTLYPLAELKRNQL